MATAKRKAPRRTGNPSFRERLFSHTVILPIIFIVMFGLTGVYALTSSSASSNCVNFSYYNSSYFENNSLTCVKDIQGILNGVTSYLKNGYGRISYDGTNIAVNGYYNAQTAAEVQYFQSNPIFSKYADATNGTVGPHTWGALCYAAYNFVHVGNFGAGDYYSLVGCHNHNGSPE